MQLIKLSDWGSTQLIGADSETYLNSQVTAAVKERAQDQATFSAHTDAKGKSWSHFYLIPFGETLQLFQRRSTIEQSNTELNKYGVFSKTTITDHSENMTWYALIGDSNTDLHQVKQSTEHCQVQLANNIRLIGVNKAAALPEELTQLPLAEQTHFEIALIKQGIAFLHAEHQNEYVPQMLNLHGLDGISFKKGCYMGQETVARMRYLGKNKRITLPFKGKADKLAINDTLELNNGENWRRAGTVISSTKLNDEVFGLAVVAADIDLNSPLRIKQDGSSEFHLLALPYSLEYKES